MSWLHYPLRRMMMVAAALLTLLVLGGTQTFALSATDFTAAEQASTLSFLQGFAASNPVLASVWSGTDFCTWSFVSCGDATTAAFLDFQTVGAAAAVDAFVLPELATDVDGGAVIFAGIRAGGMGKALAGTLPASWGRLTRLQVLHLNDNALTGTLPAAWAAMSSLYGLRLDGNRLDGGLPAEWSALEQF